MTWAQKQNETKDMKLTHGFLEKRVAILQGVRVGFESFFPELRTVARDIGTAQSKSSLNTHLRTVLSY